MSRYHDGPRSSAPRVAEPVQVYLRADERERLARLTERMDATKSEVLRRGLEALERQLSDPADHPALSVIGIAGSVKLHGDREDAARDHDRLLADEETASWGRGATKS